MNFIISALFITVGLGLQQLLSNRNNPYLGVIMPILLTIVMTWRYLTGGYSSFLAYALILGFGWIVLLVEWSNGRKSFKRQQEKELERMRVHDTL
ncbi:hypothetical protein ACV3PA_11170 [Exiguobacterium acetylicum]